MVVGASLDWTVRKRVLHNVAVFLMSYIQRCDKRDTHFLTRLDRAEHLQRKSKIILP
jgi:hypothetical protein